jgi:hypothetical protein
MVRRPAETHLFQKTKNGPEAHFFGMKQLALRTLSKLCPKSIRQYRKAAIRRVL